MKYPLIRQAMAEGHELSIYSWEENDSWFSEAHVDGIDIDEKDELSREIFRAWFEDFGTWIDDEDVDSSWWRKTEYLRGIPDE